MVGPEKTVRFLVIRFLSVFLWKLNKLQQGIKKIFTIFLSFSLNCSCVGVVGWCFTVVVAAAALLLCFNRLFFFSFYLCSVRVFFLSCFSKFSSFQKLWIRRKKYSGFQFKQKTKTIQISQFLCYYAEKLQRNFLHKFSVVKLFPLLLFSFFFLV